MKGIFAVSRSHTVALVSFVCCALPLLTLAAESIECGFDKKTLRYSGDAVHQAKCLLKPVLYRGKLGSMLTMMPEGLQCIGEPSPLSKQQLRKYLQLKGIDEAHIGGSLDRSLSTTEVGHGAIYFVIHDTSTPNYKRAEFPADIDSRDSVNDLSVWMKGQDSAAHVFVNRKGESTTPVNFDTPWRATKFELNYGSTALRGLFLHIELIQPRRRDAKLGGDNDAIAPTPGFTTAQYDRLALLYLAASARKGTCLVPAYHAAIDTGLAGGHDDPQNFSLDELSSALKRVTTAIVGTPDQPNP